MASTTVPATGSDKRRRRRRTAAPVRMQWAGLAMVALLTLTLLGPMMTIYGGQEDGGGNLVRQIGYVIIFLMSLYAVRPLLQPDRLMVVPWPLVLALIWFWLSLVWAIAPGVAFRRLILTTVIIWSCFILTRQIGYNRMLKMMRVALVIAVIASLIAVFFFPETGIHQYNEPQEENLVGDWRGVMAHKNLAGLVAALTVLFFTFDRQKIPRWLQIGVIAASVVMLVGSHSRTSMSLCAAALVLGFLFAHYSARYRVPALVLVVILGIAGALLQSSFSDPLLRQLNDPRALSGRTLIWAALYRFYGDHPLLGAGYGSFWNIGANDPIYAYATGWVTEITQGHNGFLDLLTQVGIPGLVLALFATLVWPLVWLLKSDRIEGQTGALLASAILFCIAHNGSETSLLDRDAIGNVFLMLSIALLWTAAADPARKKMRLSADILGWANRSINPPDRQKGGPARQGAP